MSNDSAVFTDIADAVPEVILGVSYAVPTIDGAQEHRRAAFARAADTFGQ